MAISDIKVTSDVEGFSLSELLELLGSSAATKKALAELEKAARKNAKALKELNASEMERQAKVDADNAKREKEINAIHKDSAALKAAWDKLEADTAHHNANIAKGRLDLRKEKAEFKSGPR